MTRALLLLVAAAFLLQEKPEVRFVAIDVMIDAGKSPLAAYQFELTGGDAARIVGVEGGAGPFREAPYHDPAALQGGRIIIAAFTTDPHPPSGRVHVARLHLMETGSPEYSAKLVVAAAPGGKPIEAKVELVRTGGKK